MLADLTETNKILQELNSNISKILETFKKFETTFEEIQRVEEFPKFFERFSEIFDYIEIVGKYYKETDYLKKRHKLPTETEKIIESLDKISESLPKFTIQDLINKTTKIDTDKYTAIIEKLVEYEKIKANILKTILSKSLSKSDIIEERIKTQEKITVNLIKSIQDWFQKQTKFLIKIESAIYKTTFAIKSGFKSIIESLGGFHFWIGVLIGLFLPQILRFLSNIYRFISRIVGEKVAPFVFLTGLGAFLLFPRQLIRFLFVITRFLLKNIFKLMWTGILKLSPLISESVKKIITGITIETIKRIPLRLANVFKFFRIFVGPIKRIPIIGVIFTLFETIKDVIDTVRKPFEGIPTALNTFSAALAGRGRGFLNAINNALKLGGLGAAIGSLIPGVGTVLGGLVGGLLGFFLGFIGGERLAKIAFSFFQDISNAVNSVVRGISQLFRAPKEFIDKFTKTPILTVFKWILTILFSPFIPIYLGFKFIYSKFKKQIDSILSFIKNIFSKISEIIKSISNKLFIIVRTIFSPFLFIINLFKSIVNLIKKIIGKNPGIIAFIQNLFELSKKFINYIGQLIKKAINILFSPFKLISKPFQLIVNIAKKIIGKNPGILALISSYFSLSKKSLNLVGEQLKSTVKLIFSTFKNLIKTINNIITTFIKIIPEIPKLTIPTFLLSKLYELIKFPFSTITIPTERKLKFAPQINISVNLDSLLPYLIPLVENTAQLNFISDNIKKLSDEFIDFKKTILETQKYRQPL